MQTCKLRWEANFLFQSFRYIRVCCVCQKTAPAIQTEIKQKWKTAEQEVHICYGLQNCLNYMAEGMRCLYLHCGVEKKPKTMWNKESGMFHLCMAYLLQADTWETQPVNPNEPRWAAGHLFSGNTSLDFAPHHNTLHSQPTLPLPSAGVLSSRDSDSSYHNSSVLDYSHPVQETGGCQQATTADTDGSPGLWWLPYVTLVLQVCASSVFFFPSLISFFVLCSLKRPEWGWRGECRWAWTGSNSMPINTFQCKVGLQPQLEVYLSLNDYWEVKDCRVKVTTFYCQKANRR